MPKANHPIDKARQLQRTLYCASKGNPKRRFHALYDKLVRKDMLWKAWRMVKANRGAAGVDGTSIQAIEDAGVSDFLHRIALELTEGRFHPLAVRRTYVPKPDGKQRPLGIPSIRDRVVQAAMKLVLEPIFEAEFLPCSFGFRPKRSAHMANELIRHTANQGHNWVVDADIQAYFDTIDQDKLLALVGQRISDRRMLKLIRLFLRAGVLEDGQVRMTESGTPQGGVLSPLLANIYLHFLDRVWSTRCRHLGTLVRYADDLVVLCRSEADANEALRRLHLVVERLGLRLHPTKTRLVDLTEGRDGFDFLGFHHRKVRSWRYRRHYLQKWPKPLALKAIRDKVRATTAPRSGLSRSLQDVIAVLNPVLRGWGTYFKVGNSSRHFKLLDDFVRARLYLFLSKKHGKSGRGWKERWASLDLYGHGLFQLSGTVVRFT